METMQRIMAFAPGGITTIDFWQVICSFLVQIWQIHMWEFTMSTDSNLQCFSLVIDLCVLFSDYLVQNFSTRSVLTSEC